MGAISNESRCDVRHPWALKTGNPGAIKALPQKDMHRLITQVMRTAGASVKEIAAKYRIGEQICRICLTHPGVDVDGILTRLEIKDL